MLVPGSFASGEAATFLPSSNTSKLIKPSLIRLRPEPLGAHAETTE